MLDAARPGENAPAPTPPAGVRPAGRPRPVDFALLFILGLIFGSTYMFIGVGLKSIPPLTLAAGRVLIGLAVLGSVAAFLGHRIPRDWRSWRAFLVIGMVGFALPFMMMNVAQQYIDSSLASILITCGPLFTLALAHRYTDDKASWRKFTGVILGFSGILLLLGPAALSGAGGSLLGQLLYVGVAFMFALTQVLIRRLGTGSGTPLIRAVCTTFATTLCLVPAAFLFEAPLAVSPRLDSVLGMVALGVLSSSVAHFILFRLNAHVGPNFVSTNNYMGPPVGILWGVLLLGEKITWLRVVAMLVIFAGIAFATARPRARRP